MAEKDQQVHPTEQREAEQPKTDVETASGRSDELRRRKKRMKCLVYVTVFAILVTAIILAFALTVMHVKNPKFRFRSVEVDDVSFSSATAAPSFSLRLETVVAIKNTNFGHYHYGKSDIILAYRGTKVGEAAISGGRAGARSTGEIELNVDVSSRNVSSDSNLAGDLSSGILSLTSYGDLSGKVHLLELFKKTKSQQMNCTINIDLVNEEIRDWNCS